MIEQIFRRIRPDPELDRQDYLPCLSDEDREHLMQVVNWLSKQVGDRTAVWAVGSSVEEARRGREVRKAGDLDLRLFTYSPNEEIDQRVASALDRHPPSGFKVVIEPSHRDFSTAHNSRLWPEDGGRAVNIISTARGDPYPADERRWRKSGLFFRDPFCRLKEAVSFAKVTEHQGAGDRICPDVTSGSGIPMSKRHRETFTEYFLGK